MTAPLKAALLVCALSLTAALAGCGGGGSGSTASTAASSATTSTTSSQRASATAQNRAAGTGKATGPNTRGGSAEDSIQGFGAQASPALRAQAAASLHAYLDSRARGDWTTACRYMSARLIAENLQPAAGSSEARKGCAAIMAASYASVPAANFRAAAVAAVGSFRAKGKRGFLLYRGAHHVDYAMPMVFEGGRWKVALTSGDPLS